MPKYGTTLMQSTTLITMTMMFTMIMTPLSKNLISLGALLLCTTLLTTMMVSKMINSWFAFILFLVLITGLLVLFSYMMAMSPNTSYMQNKSTSKVIASVMIISLPSSLTLTMTPMKGEKSFEQDVQQLFNQSNTPIYWTMGIILLIALLMAVMICYKSAKPLRSYL